MASSVRDEDRGAKALLQRLGQKPRVKVGILGTDAIQIHRETPDLTVVDVATKHEYGVGVPRRSFLRDYVDENKADLQRMVRNTGKVIIQGKNPCEALGALGNEIVGQIIDRILAHIPPENSEDTKRRKGSDTPLKDTGQLVSSIHSVVE